MEVAELLVAVATLDDRAGDEVDAELARDVRAHETVGPSSGSAPAT